MTEPAAPRSEGVLLARKLVAEAALLAGQCRQVQAGAQVLRARESAAWVTVDLAREQLTPALVDALEDLQAAPNSHDLTQWARAQHRLAEQVLDRARRLLAVLEQADAAPVTA